MTTTFSQFIYLCLFMSLTDDLDELEVYGKEEQSGVKLTSYSFEVSLLYLTYILVNSVEVNDCH